MVDHNNTRHFVCNTILDSGIYGEWPQTSIKYILSMLLPFLSGIYSDQIHIHFDQFKFYWFYNYILFSVKPQYMSCFYCISSYSANILRHTTYIIEFCLHYRTTPRYKLIASSMLQNRIIHYQIWRSQPD